MTEDRTRDRQRRAWRLLHTRGRLAVHVCALCAALVLDVGRAQHERTHAADRRDW
jgi:hypothetical protein